MVTRSEWKGDVDGFNRLDTNRDGSISRREMRQARTNPSDDSSRNNHDANQQHDDR
jgi:Ca2+-binding EF-hand superfamily protein